MIEFKMYPEEKPDDIGEYIIGAYNKDWDDDPVCTSAFWNGEEFELAFVYFLNESVEIQYTKEILENIYCFYCIDYLELPDRR